MIPKTIKIAGVRYDIEHVPELQLEHECTGHVIFGKAVIQLDAALCAEIAHATLLHEIIEVIDTENELKLPHNAIQTLATQIYQVIVDNNEVFRK